MHPNDLLTTAEASEYTRYSTRTVARWRALGLIDPVGYSGRPRYRRDDIDAVLEHLAVAGGTHPASGGASNRS